MRRAAGILFALASLFLAAPAQALSPFIVFFASGSARLTPQALAILDNAAATFVTMHVVEIEIVGGADRAGSAAYNRALSLHRAEAVRLALLERGMSRNMVVRITAAGETRPLVETEDGVAEPQNRYVFVLLHAFAPTSPLLQQNPQQ